VALVVCYAGSWLLTDGLKLLFVRPRPDVFPPLTTELGYSFPSGHALTSAALYGFLAFLCWQARRRVWALLLAFFGLWIGASRVYLGVHYPSDVLAASAVGVVWLAVVVLGYRAERFWPWLPGRRAASED
jgi:undecaprenyl-diphosphatase